MMLSHPVLLGFIWSLLLHASCGQPQISNQDNKVYAYSYHFQHNGTTNSKDILRSVLGTDGEFNFDNHDDQSIIKTFSSPNIRGFFTRGVLPAGPATHSFNSGFRSSFNSNPALDNIQNVIQSNLQPPSVSTRNLLPPISPDIRNEFPGDFNNVNDLELNLHKQDFPKIPNPAVLRNQDNFPNISPVPTVSSFGQNNFPEIPPPPPIPSLNINHLPNTPRNDNGVNKIEKFERNTPDGGKVVGEIETFSYNPPPVLNPDSNYHENAQGFRRNENFVDNNQKVTGHRSQTYFRQQFRTVTPNLESNSLLQDNRLNNRNSASPNGNNNQWWNVINVLGGNNNNGNNYNVSPNNRNSNLNAENLSRQIDQNINQIKDNIKKEVNKPFGSRHSNSNNRQNYARNNIEVNQNINNDFNNRNRDFNNQSPPRNDRNQPFITIPFNNRVADNGFNRHENNRHNNNLVNRQQTNVRQANNHLSNNVITNRQHHVNNQFNNDDTTRRAFNIINDVNSRLTNNAEKLTNDIGITWDDAVIPKNFNHDWSKRQSFGTGRSFSNGHSGPLNNPIDTKPVNVAFETLVGNRELTVPSISDVGDHGNSYRNVDGGGNEKVFGFNRVVEGPNSFNRNNYRGFERNFHVDSNSGYQRTNQWSTNTLRRLDTQSTRDDFSKDFIDVFRDDY